MMVLQYVFLVIGYEIRTTTTTTIPKNSNKNNNNISNNNYDLWFSIKAGRQAGRQAGELNFK